MFRFILDFKGAKEVVVTDLPQLVGLINENIKLNNVQANCRAEALTWGDDPAPFNPPYDVILISDVVRIIAFCILLNRKGSAGIRG